MYRALLTMVCAAFVGVIAIYAVAPVSAQDIGPDVSGNSSFHNRLLFERIFEDSGLKDRGVASDKKFNLMYERPAPYGAGDAWLQNQPLAQSKQQASRQALGRSLRNVYGKPFVRAVFSLKGGLAGAAVGIWVNNGLMLYDYQRCGETDCPDALRVDMQLMKSSGADKGLMVTRTGYGSTGPITGVVVITEVNWTYRPSTKDGIPSVDVVIDGVPKVGDLNWRVVTDLITDI